MQHISFLLVVIFFFIFVFLSITSLICFTCVEGLSKTIGGRGKVSVDSNLPDSTFWDFTRYAFVVIMLGSAGIMKDALFSCILDRLILLRISLLSLIYSLVTHIVPIYVEEGCPS